MCQLKTGILCYPHMICIKLYEMVSEKLSGCSPCIFPGKPTDRIEEGEDLIGLHNEKLLKELIDRDAEEKQPTVGFRGTQWNEGD